MKEIAEFVLNVTGLSDGEKLEVRLMGKDGTMSPYFFKGINKALALCAIKEEDVVGYLVGAPFGYGNELNKKIFWSLYIPFCNITNVIRNTEFIFTRIENQCKNKGYNNENSPENCRLGLKKCTYRVSFIYFLMYFFVHKLQLF